MTYLWINKYKPTNIDEIIGNSKKIEFIIEWLNNIPNGTQSLIISGSQGIAKTLTVELILKKMGYIVRIINTNDIKEHRNYNDFDDYYNFNNSVYSKINLNNNNKVALIIDEIENITLTSEKKFIMDIYKENNKIKSFPLIFISNNQHSKLLNELKKGCTEVIFNVPTIKEITKLIYNICDNENITFTSDKILEDIITFSQYDIRRLINLLQELSYHNINSKINKQQITEFINKSKEKNINIGLFESTNKILNNYLDYETTIKYYETEKVLLPLMIHENYIKKILYKSDNLWNNITNITESLSYGDNIETSIYTDQNWYLQNIHGFFTCLNTSYWINKNKCDKTDNKINNINFSLDLNKTSLKNINRKNILNLSKFINNKSNLEILMLNKICNNFIENNKESELIKILNGYNQDITIKDIELCLKIDKTTEFNKLASKDKKIITKIINNNKKI
jgi:replication factor C subunit 1